MQASDATTRPLPDVLDDRGLHLLGTVLWFDAHVGRDLCFLSNGGLREPGQHRKLVCTAETLAFFGLRDRRMAEHPRALTAPFGRFFRIGPLTLELWPAGHMLGAAQALVQHDGRRVLYTGTLCTEELPTASPAALVPADLMVVAARCVPPESAFASRAAASAQLVAFVEQALAEGAIPVLLAEELGTAQDALRTLLENGQPVQAHPSVHHFLAAYERSGCPELGSVPLVGRRPRAGAAFVCPQRLYGGALLRDLRKARTAWLGYRTTAAVDAVIPFGNLSTADELVAHAKAAAPARVVFAGPQDALLADRASEAGLEAVALSRTGQLSLGIG